MTRGSMTPAALRASLADAVVGAAVALTEDGPDEGLAKLWLYYRSQDHDTTVGLYAAALIELAQLRGVPTR